MPELPEVEIARRNLERWLVGRRIVGARVLDPLALRGQSPRQLVRVLRGATVRAVERRGKHLIVNLGKRGRITSHFGMSGKMVLRDAKEAIPPASRVVLQLSRGRKLAFVDVRRLGGFQLVDDVVDKKLRSLGVEPLEESFTPSCLAEFLAGARLPIKPFLMDQRRVAGLGNIHAAEALFRARVHPKREAASLSKSEVRAVHRGIRAKLNETLRKDTSDELRYLHEGDSENRFLVYGRRGEPCSRCATKIDRMVQGGRSTFYCPRCQRVK